MQPTPRQRSGTKRLLGDYPRLKLISADDENGNCASKAMPEVTERVQLVQAIFAGLKDLAVVVASVATIWLQAQTSAKQDTIIEKQDSAVAVSTEVKKDLAASSKERDTKLDTIIEYAKSGPMNASPAPNP